MTEARTTTDHDRIRSWIEERDGKPARVAESGEGGILRVDFDPSDEGLEPIGWDEFFRIFDENGLAFLHQDRTEDGSISRFNKFVDRDANA
ncbi:MAG: hypothetical protein K5872_14735 [Rhizobiaceae bacterium]|nr:hypothetical protein [Rhizobiaceae bacterium]MCV0407477.1 hypothetical protein [Rhizobiaceae bacterium]